MTVSNPFKFLKMIITENSDEEGKRAVYHHSSGMICIPYMVMTMTMEKREFLRLFRNFPLEENLHDCLNYCLNICES